MNDEVLVKVEGVAKKFCRSLKRSLWYGVQDVTSELLRRAGGHEELRKNEFWAVNDVSFELKRGECLGLIGPNGAGKSTLLKMLNGLIKPDRGRITMRGRVGALIELGAGFNPILTARENIYVNGSVLGFSKKEIDKKFDAIVDFAEIEEFIDTPVQNFSSGMKVRLGFAVAAQMEPDVLLIDEVLAVGDVGFVTKCMNKIDNLSRKSVIVLVSHSMPMISRMASDVLCCESGETSYLGSNVALGIQKYLGHFNPPEGYLVGEYFDLTEIIVRTTQGVHLEDDNLDFGDGLSLEMQFRTKKPVPRFYANVAFVDSAGKMVAQCFSANSDFEISKQDGLFWLSMELSELLLNPGRYSIEIDLVQGLANHRRGEILYKNTNAATINVTKAMTGWAPVQFMGKWGCRPIQQSEIERHSHGST